MPKIYELVWVFFQGVLASTKGDYNDHILQRVHHHHHLKQRAAALEKHLYMPEMCIRPWQIPSSYFCTPGSRVRWCNNTRRKAGILIRTPSVPTAVHTPVKCSSGIPITTTKPKRWIRRIIMAHHGTWWTRLWLKSITLTRTKHHLIGLSSSTVSSFLSC